jgi:two-component system, LuxR family, response regulator FixJ
MAKGLAARRRMTDASTVFIVDDDADVRESMTWLLELGGFRVETYATAEAFLAAHDPSKRGCIVLDMCMPGFGGLDLQKELARRGDGRPIIMITAFGDVSGAVGALKGGAFDFIEKPFSDEAILESIRHAIAVDRESQDARSKRGKASSLLARLTPRQRQVMELLVAGKPNKIVAAELGLSPKTVEVHRARVMAKLEVQSFAELVRLSVDDSA